MGLRVSTAARNPNLKVRGFNSHPGRKYASHFVHTGDKQSETRRPAWHASKHQPFQRPHLGGGVKPAIVACVINLKRVGGLERSEWSGRCRECEVGGVGGGGRWKGIPLLKWPWRPAGSQRK